MSEFDVRLSLLDLFYQQYLTDENSATFIDSISRFYSIGTMERLAVYGGPTTRRAAILGLGFLGDFSVNEIMGNALVDEDPAVRLLADHSIRDIWVRQGNVAEQNSVKALYRLVSQVQMDEVIDAATLIIESNPTLGEAWHQRAIAYCALGYFDSAVSDCQETLNCNRFHFPAAMGMAHCFLKLDYASQALGGFRLALQINPDLDGVRSQITHLERLLKEG